MRTELDALNELALRAGVDIFLKQQDLIWDQIKHVSTLEIATLAAWFYLTSKANYGFAILTLVFSCLFLFVILLIIRRQAQLQDQYRRGINRIIVAKSARASGPLSSDNFSTIKKHSIKIRAYVLARSIPFIAIAGNITLALISLQLWLPLVFQDSPVPIFITPTITVIASIYYLTRSTKILNKFLVD